MNNLLERLAAPLERLTSPLDVDAYLSTVSPLLGTRLRGVIHSVVPQTETAASIRIRPGRRWQSHRPGQFVTVGVDVNGVRQFRCFSLTSVPGSPEGLIEITVESASGGLVSTHLVRRARSGDVVQLSQAEGEFVLPASGAPTDGSTGSGSKVLFVTGGSGITPVMGMLRSMVASGSTRDVVVLHHSRSPGSTIFGTELQALAEQSDMIQLVSTYTAEGGARLDAGRLDRECPDWMSRQVYACGPRSLVDFVQSHWEEAGMSERVHVEHFTLTLPKRTAMDVGSGHGDVGDGAAGTDAGAKVNSAGQAGSTRFVASNVEVPSATDVPILEVAEAAGLAPAHGCRMGICHTCTTRLDEGCVTDLRDGRISEAGSYVQICVSAAIGDVSLGL